LNERATIEAEEFLKKEQSNYDNLSMEQAYLAYKFVFI
jgi:ABC-type Fe3+-hydroxamate transport system substrate-binding protein